MQNEESDLRDRTKHVAAALVGGEPELRFEADVRGIVGG